MPIKQLVKLPGNPRKIGKKGLRMLEDSIRANGFWKHRPIAISTRTGHNVVICGNQRLKAAQNVGLRDVPVIVYDNLDESTENEIILRDNVANGEWDFGALQSEQWADIDFENFGIDFLDSDDDSSQTCGKS